MVQKEKFAVGYGLVCGIHGDRCPNECVSEPDVEWEREMRDDGETWMEAIETDDVTEIEKYAPCPTCGRHGDPHESGDDEDVCPRVIATGFFRLEGAR